MILTSSSSLPPYAPPSVIPSAASRIGIFLQNADKVFFWVHEPTFYARIMSNDPRIQPPRSFLEPIYLMACFFTSRSNCGADQSLAQYEAHFLDRARRALDEALSYSEGLMDFLKGSVLVTTYLFLRGRFLEGCVSRNSSFYTRLDDWPGLFPLQIHSRYHANCGVATFALSCGLHRIPSSAFHPGMTPSSSPSEPRLLQPPFSQIELGERILVFWNIFTWDKISSVVTGFLSVMPGDDKIDTPFPHTLAEYEVVSALP